MFQSFQTSGTIGTFGTVGTVSIFLWEQLASSRAGLAVPAGFETAKIIPGSLRAALQRDLGAEGAALLGSHRADFAQRRRLKGLLGIVFQDQSRVENFLKVLADDDNAVAAQQGGALVADDLAQPLATLRIGDQLGFRIKRHAVAEDRALP